MAHTSMTPTRRGGFTLSLTVAAAVVAFAGWTVTVRAAQNSSAHLAKSDLIQPAELASRISTGAEKPVIIQVGFNVLYRSKHIPGAAYAGPASRPQGIEALRHHVQDLSRNANIVLYCGCCPWDKCPNVRPAFALLRSMGFKHVKVLLIPTNFAKDWIEKGYPVVKGE